MVTIHTEKGLRFVVFPNDHEPAHVHVFGDGQIKIDLASADSPSLVWADGMSRGDIRKAMRIAAKHRDAFLARWRDIHG